MRDALLAEDVAGFLTSHHGAPVADLERLSGGHWSAAYAYRVADDELVLRIGTERDWFEIDRAAMRYSCDALPVPDVLDIGDSPFGGVYAISRRHRGRFLETVTPDDAPRARPMLASLLGALRDAPPGPPATASWREWLLAGLADQADHPTAGWRTKLAAHPDAERVFVAAEARLHELVPDVPERRDLVHGDLLHGNVLVSDDASRVSAVFSWKCAARGDFLFDAAWCTFWGATFHPGIDVLDAFELMRGAEVDAAERHHCYELHIGASHLGWNAWVDDVESLARVSERVGLLLERGPR